jgi:hypothetical protein
MEKVAEKKRNKKARARNIDEHLEGIFSESAPLIFPVLKISEEEKDSTNSRKVNSDFLFYEL